MNKVMDEQGKYLTDDAILKMAKAIVDRRWAEIDGDPLTSPEMTREMLAIKFAGVEHEVFTCIFLNTMHKVLAVEDMFRGTVDGASVHPREVVKRALQLNASAVIFAHNHPSGNPEPSQADQRITQRLRDALGIVDVRVLDHFVVGQELVSFAERGLL